MLGVAFYERLDQSCLAYPGRSNHGDNDRRSFLRQSVDQRDMQSLFFDLETFSSRINPCWERLVYIVGAGSLFVQTARVGECKGLRIRS